MGTYVYHWCMANHELTLVAGLDARDVVARVRRALRMRDCGNRALAFYHWELHERGLAQRERRVSPRGSSAVSSNCTDSLQLWPEWERIS